MVRIGNDWDEVLRGEWDKPYYLELRSFLNEEYRNETIYPPARDVFNALRMTPYKDVKVVILGQDPYHEPGQAQGLSFSVPCSMSKPPSLVNILKELESDVGLETTEISGEDGILFPWAGEGVLLLNTVLTVRAHKAGSHRGKGWETFTDRIIELLVMREEPMVFILWGANAAEKKSIIKPARRHLVIEAPHPSPLSAYRGFFGGRYFSRCNYFLEDNGIKPVNWSIGACSGMQYEGNGPA